MQNAATYIREMLNKPEKDPGYGWFTQMKEGFQKQSSAHDIGNILTYSPEPGIRLSVNNCTQATIKLSGRRMYTAAQKDIKAGSSAQHPCLVTKFLSEKLIPILWVHYGSFGDWYICFNCATEEYVGAIYASGIVTECRKYNTSDLPELIERVNSGEREVRNWGISENKEI